MRLIPLDPPFSKGEVNTYRRTNSVCNIMPTKLMYCPYINLSLDPKLSWQLKLTGHFPLKLKQAADIHGAVVATAKPCPYATIHTGNFQKKNPSSLSPGLPEPCIYVAAHKRKHRPTVTAATNVKPTKISYSWPLK
ncbi:MAG: hypothetical protein Q8N96_09820 [Methylovulum sp.]|nr:hypothetical protein [Methylovulum sp.]